MHPPGACCAPDGPLRGMARYRRREIISPPRPWLVLTMDFREDVRNCSFHRTEIGNSLLLRIWTGSQVSVERKIGLRVRGSRCKVGDAGQRAWRKAV